MPSTYTPIATQTLTTGTATITFSSIPQTYTDLVLIITGNSAVGTAAFMRFNGDSGNNYSATFFQGDGTSVGSYRETNATANWAGSFYNTTTPSLARHNIMNYSNTSTFKSSLSRVDYAIGFTAPATQLWRNTAAITSIALSVGSSFSTGSIFTLYGIKAA
jgi:hypothetical protein